MDRDLVSRMITSPRSLISLGAALALMVGCGDAEGSRFTPRAGSTSAAQRSADRGTGQDTIVAAAERALEQRRPWHATELLAPLVSDPARRTPHIVLLAATAAAEWRGWRQVRDLLGAETWVDTLEGGRGRALLARAALGLGEDSTAVTEARRAADAAHTDGERGVRLVLLARALDRIDA